MKQQILHLLVNVPVSLDEAYNHPETDKKVMWHRAKNESKKCLGEILEVGDSQRTKLYQK
jgi:hypothetical protein